MAINDGGPAFPQHVLNLKADKQSSLACNYGMSLRDWFAGQALAGLVTNLSTPVRADALWAYQAADAMLNIREEPKRDQAKDEAPDVPADRGEPGDRGEADH